MIALLACIALGATHFVEQPLPGLSVSSRAFPAALARANTVTVDLNSDGATDLLLPSGVWLQKDGAFSRTTLVPLPEQDRRAAVHIEHGRLYAYADAHLRAYTFVAQAWQSEWEASLDLESGMQSAETPLFHDLDADGRAELILPVRTALRVFRMVPGAPAVGDLNVYPPVRPRLTPTANLWNSAPLRASADIAARDVHITLTSATVETRESLRVTNNAFDRRITAFSLTQSPEKNWSTTLISEAVYPALPENMIACHLRKEGPIAFAGARPLPANRLRLGQTITEVLLAIEPGTPIASLRTKSAPAHLAFADFDADGDFDLLAQSNTLESRPPREILMALASARRIRHEFFVHVQESSGRFDPRPRREFFVDLDLDGPALEGGPRWDAYRRGELTCSAGDFNGDGRADIAAWSTAGRIDVWLNHEGVFEKKADTNFQPGTGRGFLPVDVDADGKTDLVILPETGAGEAVRVFFSR